MSRACSSFDTGTTAGSTAADGIITASFVAGAFDAKLVVGTGYALSVGLAGLPPLLGYSGEEAGVGPTVLTDELSRLRPEAHPTHAINMVSDSKIRAGLEEYAYSDIVDLPIS
ncbi:MAG: hypothetical protein K1X74_06350 [Pirellulales bacterium]|nr:hypothetical protein [Pirellulales bacterium]